MKSQRTWVTTAIFASCVATGFAGTRFIFDSSCDEATLLQQGRLRSNNPDAYAEAMCALSRIEGKHWISVFEWNGVQSRLKTQDDATRMISARSLEVMASRGFRRKECLDSLLALALGDSTQVASTAIVSLRRIEPVLAELALADLLSRRVELDRHSRLFVVTYGTFLPPEKVGDPVEKMKMLKMRSLVDQETPPTGNGYDTN